MSVERCEIHSLHYDTDLKLCCPICEEAESQEITALREALAQVTAERDTWKHGTLHRDDVITEL